LLDRRPLCDRCADRRLAAATGWPPLPEPPAPEVVVGPDGRRHFVRYRLLRLPGAVLALAEELGEPASPRHRLELRCGHLADPRPLLGRLRADVRAAISYPYLEPEQGHGWGLAGDRVGGYLEEDDPEQGEQLRVLVDGRSLSWEELGDLLRPYVGWSFELRLGGALPSRDGGDTGGRTLVRSPTPVERRAAARALRGTAGAYVLDSAHYPSHDGWALAQGG
jgi:hypothetical protein